MSVFKLTAIAVSAGLAASAASLSPILSAHAAVVDADLGRAQRSDATVAECTLSGDEGPNAFQGTTGDDVICGMGGNDRFKSSPGDDTYIGGDGRDTVDFFYTNVPTGVRADLLTGVATGHGTDALDGIEDLIGTPYRDVLRGDSQTHPDGYGNGLSGGGRGDVLGGRGGDDRIFGAHGNDTLIPGPGNDDAYGDAGIDTISFKLSTGPVTVDMTASPSAIGQGTDYAYGENIIGSPYDDTMTGNREGYGADAHDANTLWGLAGDDTLSGGPLGNDTLYGQAGDDHLDGSTGTDHCDGGADNDTSVACETSVSIP